MNRLRRMMMVAAMGGAGAVSPLLTNLVAYWTLDETSAGVGAVTRNDSVGTNHLADVNTTPSAAGKVTNAAFFTAASIEHLDDATPDSALQMGDIDFTVAMWVNFTSIPQQGLLAKASGGSPATAEYWIDYLASTTNRIRFVVSDGAGFGVVQADALGVPNTETWYLVIAWHDATADKVYIQVNNGTVNEAAWANGVRTSSDQFRLGGYGQGSPWADAKVDEVGIWKRLLTSDERSALYNGGQGTTYPF